MIVHPISLHNSKCIHIIKKRKARVNETETKNETNMKLRWCLDKKMPLIYHK